MTWKAWLALTVGIVLGFISACAIQQLLEAKKRSWAKRTAADCLIISRALEDFHTVNGGYPPLDKDIEHLRECLVPKYLRQLPTRDASNERYLVVMDGPRVAVISVGPYGAVAEAGNLIRGGGK